MLTCHFLYVVNKAQPYRAPPKNTAVGSRGDTGKVEELSAQVRYDGRNVSYILQLYVSPHVYFIDTYNVSVG